MCPDTTASIIAAAKRRHELTRAKAIQAIRELDRAGAIVTFAAVAAAAGVSRSWLYSQPGIREQIQQLRDTASRSAAAPIPASQRASDASLQRRLQAARGEHEKLLSERAQLLQERDRLRRQVARLLGEQRQTGTPAREPPF
jgi:hypothetical protein